MNNYKNKGLREYLLSIPPEKIKLENEKAIKETDRQHKQFINYLNKGKCYMCKHSLNSFKENEPCLHWLLLPDGIKKRKLLDFLNSGIGIYRVQTYLRWLSNSELFMGKINDLKEDKPDNVFLLETIRYRNLEWTLQIGKTDLEGHSGKNFGSSPHYHIQILKNDKIFMKFNDFHIGLSDDDLFWIACKDEASDLVFKNTSFTASLSAIFDFCDKGFAKNIDDSLSVVPDESQSVINRQTLIKSSPDNPISMDLIIKASKESEKTKEPIGRILSRYQECKDMKFTTVLEPSDNIPELKKRKQRKSK